MLKKIWTFCTFCVMLVALTVIVGCANQSASTVPKYNILAKLVDDTIVADQKVQFVNNSGVELHSLHFNLYANAFRKDATHYSIFDGDKPQAWVDGESFGEIQILGTSINGRHVAHNIQGADRNILAVDTNLKVRAAVEVGIKFLLTLPKLKFRLGVNNFAINLGQWYPTLAVLQDGKFLDNPYYYIGDPFVTDVADYDIQLTTPLGYEIASSGQYSRFVNKFDTQTFFTSAKLIREFAIVLSKHYKVVQKVVGHTTVFYNFYKDDSPQDVLIVAQKALITFSSLFGEYPYQSLTMAQTQFLYGGMEYSGLVMLSDLLNREKYIEAVVHEIAHQWWYGVVGNDQVQHAWMDEALAEYSTTVFFEKHPEYGIGRRSKVGKSITALSIYSDINSSLGANKRQLVMDKPLSQFDTIAEYVTTVYAMGNVMFDSLRDFIGDDKFFSALKDYFGNFAFLIAKPKDLVQAFDKNAHVKMQDWFASWLQGNIVLWS